MEKNLTKAKLISYLQSEDQEISQAAFGYVIRDIIHNVHPLLQMPEVIKYSRHISFARKEEILLEISSKLQGYQEISHFIQLSYWYPNQLFLISRFLETTLDANLEAKLLEIIGDKKKKKRLISLCPLMDSDRVFFRKFPASAWLPGKPEWRTESEFRTAQDRSSGRRPECRRAVPAERGPSENRSDCRTPRRRDKS